MTYCIDYRILFLVPVPQSLRNCGCLHLCTFACTYMTLNYNVNLDRLHSWVCCSWAV